MLGQWGAMAPKNVASHAQGLHCLRSGVLSQRRARDSNPQPLAGHLISNQTANHSLTLQEFFSLPAVFRQDKRKGARFGIGTRNVGRPTAQDAICPVHSGQSPSTSYML